MLGPVYAANIVLLDASIESLFPRQSRGLDKTWGPSKGLKIKNTVMLNSFQHLTSWSKWVRSRIKSGMTFSFFGTTSTINRYFGALKSYIPENVKLWESPGKAGGLPQSRVKLLSLDCCII